MTNDDEGLSDAELLRYSRQIMLPDFDVAGQERLLAARVLIVGLGGLGSPAALYLAAAGVGALVLCDDDRVDPSNLQRQIAHGEADLDRPKVASAADALRAIRPELTLSTVNERLRGDALRNAVAQVDLVVDASDNFSTRFALNDACLAAGIPLVSGAAIRWEGQIAVFDPRRRDAPCYRCLYESGDDEALNCAENGVIAPLVGIVGCCQALEAVKVLAGVGEPLTGYLLAFDGKRMEWRKLRLRKNPNCPSCNR